MTTMVTFQIVFAPGNRFVGMAWTPDVFVVTQACETYEIARRQLGEACRLKNLELSWFNGEYHFDAESGMLVPFTEWPPDTEPYSENQKAPQ